MSTGIVYIIIFTVLAIGAVILGIMISKSLKESNTIELVQGKLQNSDSSIADAMSYLKITNEWSK
uniref:hypothetical protein n=1 Tax=Acetatifactor sp. TaxID=1872090 RepID=UPI0040569392